VTHHQWMMVIGGSIAVVFAFLRGLLTGNTGRVDQRPDERWINYTSSDRDAPAGDKSRGFGKVGTLQRPGTFDSADHL
jgi:hypothetical protein